MLYKCVEIKYYIKMIVSQDEVDKYTYISKKGVDILEHDVSTRQA